MRIAAPVGEPALRRILREVVTRNRVRDGLVYLQISRGAARRDHGFPAASVAPGLVVTAKSIDPALGEANAEPRREGGHGCPTNAGRIRTSRRCSCCRTCWPSRPRARPAPTEAWFVDPDGFVTEGASTNAWIVDADGALVTRQADQAILRGVTRSTLLDVAASQGLSFHERPFSVEEAYRAREAFFSSATTIAMPVVAIDGRPIGDGRPGPLTLALRRKFHDVAERT